MTERKIQSHASLRREMMAVARGERSAPHDAAMPGFSSIEAMTRLPTSENRALLATIHDRTGATQSGTHSRETGRYWICPDAAGRPEQGADRDGARAACRN